MVTFGAIEGCQVCGEDALTSALFLAYLPPVNTMRPVGGRPDAEEWYPAELLYCPRCHLVQLGYAVDPRILFPPEYPYTSGSTRILREDFADLYREVNARVGLRPEDLVVDIGSNDGTLLSNFKEAGHRVCGIEPTMTGEIARERGIPTMMSFFNSESVAQLRSEHGAPRVVTATNVFAHIHGVRDVMSSVEELVAPDGVFVTESHYLRDLLETLQYDTIYHEHLRYYSLTSLKYLLNAHGFRVFHVKRIPTHGGSIRVYATKSGDYPEDPSVERELRAEKAMGMAGESWIPEFRSRVSRSKLQLYSLLDRLKAQGAAVYGIGAPSRASTLITYTGLDDALLSCVLEISTSKKLNKYMPGTRIPVLDEAKLYADQPPYALLLSWHIADELCRNLARRGYRGDFIVPLPEPRVISNAAASTPA